LEDVPFRHADVGHPDGERVAVIDDEAVDSQT
jgi:hypothetical protein